MPDIATISAALSSIKTATEIAKYFRDSDFTLEKAEMKLKLADLVGVLADVKMELAEVQDLILERDRTIAELKEAFEEKGTLARVDDAYYKIDESGHPIGVAYCLRCWEGDHKMRQLVGDPSGSYNVCTNCGHQYDSWASGKVKTSKD